MNDARYLGGYITGRKAMSRISPAMPVMSPVLVAAPPAPAGSVDALRRWRGLATGALAACLLLALALGAYCVAEMTLSRERTAS